MAREAVFYYDIACPYAYVASTRLGTLIAATGAHITCAFAGAIRRPPRLLHAHPARHGGTMHGARGVT